MAEAKGVDDLVVNTAWAGFEIGIDVVFESLQSHYPHKQAVRILKKIHKHIGEQCTDEQFAIRLYDKIEQWKHVETE